MIYEIRLSDQVKLDLVQLAKSEPKVFAKVSDDADVTLLTIYDKGEIENVSDEYIKWLISETGK